MAKTSSKQKKEDSHVKTKGFSAVKDIISKIEDKQQIKRMKKSFLYDYKEFQQLELWKRLG